MMFVKNYAIAAIGLLVSLSSFAQADDTACVVMKTGKYKGQCLDTTAKKAVHILDQSADQITIANFRKNGEFFKAVIPLNQVESLSYEVVDLNAKPVNFLSLINISHTEMRFKMKPGSVIELYPLGENDTGAAVQTETDMMVSMNYMAPKGVAYDPMKGFNAKLYGSVLQIFSTQDEIKKRFVDTKANVYEIKLTISSEQAAAVLRQALIVSDKSQYNVPYDTWSSNCTTFLFDILDAGLGLKNQKPYRFSPLIANDAGLKPAFKALGQRHAVVDTTRVKLLNSEFGYSIFPSNSNRYFNKWVGRSLKDAQ